MMRQLDKSGSQILTNMDPERWYFKDGQGNQILSTQAGILAAIESGTLPSDTLVWHPGNQGWEPAYTVREFRKLIPPPLPAERASRTEATAASTQGPAFGEGMLKPSIPIGRAHFIGYWLLGIVAQWAAVLPLLFTDSPGPTLFLGVAILMLAVAVAQIIFIIKRLRDIQASPWLALLLLVPIAGFGLILVLVFKRGTISTTGSMKSTPASRNILESYELPISSNNPLWLLLPVLSFATVGVASVIGTAFSILLYSAWFVCLFGLASIPEAPTESNEVAAT